MELGSNQAFEIPVNIDFDPKSEPTTGDEYLSKMIYERNNCPAIMVKPFKPSNNHENSSNAVIKDDLVDISSPNLRPTNEWKEFQIKNYNDMQDKIILLREQLQISGFSYDNCLPLTNNIVDWEKFCKENLPLLSIILRIDQRSLEDLIEFEFLWLEDIMENDIDLNTTERWLGSWIFATLCCLRYPLEPNTYSVLRNIAKYCIKIRNNLGPDDIFKANPYNIFILLISAKFHQLDLAAFV